MWKAMSQPSPRSRTARSSCSRPPSTVSSAAGLGLAERHRLPAIYPFRHYALDGGLMAYGFDPTDLFLRSADYVDRILKGAKPADLPVQAPTQFDLVVNLTTAKALGLSLTPTLLARAETVD